jgi:hypothetical protein
MTGPRRELFDMLTQFEHPTQVRAADVSGVSRRCWIYPHPTLRAEFQRPGSSPQPSGSLGCLEVSSASEIKQELLRIRFNVVAAIATKYFDKWLGTKSGQLAQWPHFCVAILALADFPDLIGHPSTVREKPV